MCSKKCTSFFRLLFFDIIFPIVYRSVALYNIYTLHQRGDAGWAYGTLALMLVPGLMETIYWIWSGCAGESDPKTTFLWVIGFNPIFFPVAVIIWHIWLLFRLLMSGPEVVHEYYSTSKVFKCLHAFTDSALQTILQVTILFINWFHHTDNSNYIQILHLLVSLMSLSVTCSEHHIHEKSAKQIIPRARDVARNFTFYYLLIAIRIVTLGFLASYLKFYFLILPFVLLIVNFTISHLVLKTDFVKNVWTAVASVAVPVCFVSRDTIEVYKNSLRKHPGDRFFSYYLINTICFTVAVIPLMWVLGEVILEQQLITYQCHELPLFSCQGSCSSQLYYPFSCASEGLDHSWSFALVIAMTVLNGLSPAFLWIHKKMCTRAFGREDDVDAI